MLVFVSIICYIGFLRGCEIDTNTLCENVILPNYIMRKHVALSTKCSNKT